MRLSTPLQTQHFKRMFVELNPFGDPSLIDFKANVDETLSFEENLEVLADAYPQHRWNGKDDYVGYHQAELKREAENYGLELVNSKTLTVLRNKAEKLDARKPASVKLVDEAEQVKKVKPGEGSPNGLLARIVDDMILRPLLVVGASRSGKTVMVKALVDELKRRGVKQITVFDPSLAWWNNSPLSYREVSEPLDEYDDDTKRYDFVCDVSRFIGDDRNHIIKDIIEREYVERVDERRATSCEPKSFPFNIMVIEEAQTVFRKYGLPGERIYDWVSMGLNFNMSGIYTTQRPAEVPTEIIERCNLLVGYVDGHRNLQKLRGATNREFMENVRRIKQETYEFIYYDGGKGVKVKTDNRLYGDPETVTWIQRRPSVEEFIGDSPQGTKKNTGFWWWVAGAITLLLALIELIW